MGVSRHLRCRLFVRGEKGKKGKTQCNALQHSSTTVAECADNRHRKNLAPVNPSLNGDTKPRAPLVHNSLYAQSHISYILCYSSFACGLSFFFVCVCAIVCDLGDGYNKAHVVQSHVS